MPRRVIVYVVNNKRRRIHFARSLFKEYACFRIWHRRMRSIYPGRFYLKFIGTVHLAA